jgi:hypothetical protein
MNLFKKLPKWNQISRPFGNKRRPVTSVSRLSDGETATRDMFFFGSVLQRSPPHVPQMGNETKKVLSGKSALLWKEASPGQADGFPGSGSTAPTSLLGHFSPSGEPAQRLVPKTRSLGGISAQPMATRFSRARGDVGSRAGWQDPLHLSP